MVIPYYDQTKVKLDLRITDTALDTQLDHWGDEAEADINSAVTDKAKKARRITSLPVLPYAAGSVPEQVQGAADQYVKMRYYEYTKNPTLAKEMSNGWHSKINNYIENELELDRVFYWRIAR
jgi:hypothetical protein